MGVISENVLLRNEKKIILFIIFFFIRVGFCDYFIKDKL